MFALVEMKAADSDASFICGTDRLTSGHRLPLPKLGAQENRLPKAAPPSVTTAHQANTTPMQVPRFTRVTQE